MSAPIVLRTMPPAPVMPRPSRRVVAVRGMCTPTMPRRCECCRNGTVSEGRHCKGCKADFVAMGVTGERPRLWAPEVCRVS